ncbi:MAG: T9SS type A sorting domain-containing protein, partial [candidate division Zixibacteria bacterium]
IAPQTITFDTITVTDAQLRTKSTIFIDGSGANDPFIPQFVTGTLTLHTPPPSLDSIWVTDTVVEASDKFSLGIGLYNEADTKDVQVALSFAPEFLVCDSHTVVGTRGEAIAQRSFNRSNLNGRLLLELNPGEALPLEPGSGLVANIWFTVLEGVVDTLLTIDTSTYQAQFTFINLTAAAGGTQIIPIFDTGLVEIATQSGIEDITDENNLPTDYALGQNYPNPFNPSTQIEFALPRPGEVKLEVFNILGRQVRSLLNQTVPAGRHRISFDGRSDSGKLLSSGVYFYRLMTEDYKESKKMVLLK